MTDLKTQTSAGQNIGVCWMILHRPRSPRMASECSDLCTGTKYEYFDSVIAMCS